MSLLFSLTDPLDQAATPKCAPDYGERITQILLSKTVVSASGNVPTAAEFGTAYTSGLLMFFRGLSNCHRLLAGDNEIEVIYKERVDKRYFVEGRIRLISEAISRACEKLDRYSSLYMYYITEKNYCYGPYKATPNFNDRIFDGKGNPTFISFRLDFFSDTDYSNYDSDYEDFTDSYIILTTEDGDYLTTEDGEIIIL